MFYLIKTTLKIYFKHFFYYLKVISPILIPLIVLRLVAQFAYFGRLRNVFSTIFGIILFIVFLFVEIILIQSSYKHAVNKDNKLFLSDELKKGGKIFFKYIALSFIILIATALLPFLLEPLKNLTDDKSILNLTIDIITNWWMASLVFLFILSFYVLIIEKQSIKSSLSRGVHLFLYKPFLFVSKLIVGTFSFGFILTIFSAITTVFIAILTKKIDLVLNTELASRYSPWWQQLVIDVYALVGLPLLIIFTSLLFYEVQQKEKASKNVGSSLKLETTALAS